uniref:Uncharacterized protein n=1 Tax=Anguilla anguilla TaxID=7936 RepID=A0A0E9PTY5_ANGAN
MAGETRYDKKFIYKARTRPFSQVCVCDGYGVIFFRPVNTTSEQLTA